MLRFLAPIGLLLASSCASPTTGSTAVSTSGSLREALRDGQTHTRIKLADLDLTDRVGVGAATDLDGEITLIDGECYVSRVREGEVVTEGSAAAEATILFEARVAEWQSRPVANDVPASSLADLVEREARLAGLDVGEPFPFVIEGTLTDVAAHVLNGECAVRAAMLGRTMTTPPLDLHFDELRGRLVGIYARDGGGLITHHGSPTHVHVVAGSPDTWTGHCDAAGVRAGATLRLPTGSR